MDDNSKQQNTLVLIKPDALLQSMTGYVFSLLAEVHTGLRFAGMKVVSVSRLLAAEHYAAHREKPFFASLVDYLTGRVHYPRAPERRRVIALVYQGPDAIARVRFVVGPTNPHKARDERPGCIRSLGTVVPILDAEGRQISERMDNLVHASATPDEAEHEIKLWFRPSDIPPLMRTYETEICDTSFHVVGQPPRLGDVRARDAICLLGPGELIWKSDLETLHGIRNGTTPPERLGAVAAKYLINRLPEAETDAG